MTGTNLEEDKRKEQKFGPEAEAYSKQGVEVEEDGGGDQDRELFIYVHRVRDSHKKSIERLTHCLQGQDSL